MRVAIIGLGLIGGSLGLALKRTRGEELEIVGYARRPEAATEALRRRAVDATVPDLASAARDCDLAFICTPVRTVEEVLRVLSTHVTDRCLITDTASTKRQVMAWASEHLRGRGIGFVGGHPMAGKEKFGIEAAEADLFNGCTYCVTPAEWTTVKDIDLVLQVIEWLRARPLLIDAQEHDFLVAGISHLPILVSAALVAATTGDPRWPTMAKLAASGYRDATRLASGNPQVNNDIFSTNRESVLHWVDRFSQALAKLREQVASEHSDLEATLKLLSEARQKWLEGRWPGWKNNH
ncbi:MAG: prephenate dehydrogenase/arogenate dehydrogenase family protein [Chloroflexota bacterium]